MVRENRYLKLMKEIYLKTFIKRLNMLAFAFLLAYSLNLLSAPSLQILALFLAFILFYSSVYFYNDLIDYEFDRKRKPVPEQKLLVKGFFSKEEYKLLFLFSLSLGFLLLLSFNPMFAFGSLFLVILNLARSHVPSLNFRIVSIFFVELINLILFWFLLTGEVLNAYVLPLFSLYSLVYICGFHVYKKNKKIDRKSAKLYAIPFIIFAYLSFPVLLERGIIIALSLGFLLHTLCVWAKREGDINMLTNVSMIGMLLSAMVFLSYPFVLAHAWQEKGYLSVKMESLPEDAVYLLYTQPKNLLGELNERCKEINETFRNLGSVFRV
ncbi:MAG: hypothetical protein DRO65_03805 [Candidatus Altiarchaeales archaeon]|nr:MAG: hypothetical protein DRO65_03805 [Candidatus Altiarchaeales archaeon]